MIDRADVIVIVYPAVIPGEACGKSSHYDHPIISLCPSVCVVGAVISAINVAAFERILLRHHDVPRTPRSACN